MSTPIQLKMVGWGGELWNRWGVSLGHLGLVVRQEFYTPGCYIFVINPQ